MKPGDFYEDCFSHPCLCTSCNGDDVDGISLVDGSTPRGCSIRHCGVVKISAKDAIDMKFNGPKDKAFAETLPYRWWEDTCASFKDGIIYLIRLAMSNSSPDKVNKILTGVRSELDAEKTDALLNEIAHLIRQSKVKYSGDELKGLLDSVRNEVCKQEAKSQLYGDK